jgi:hypothetical protein
VDERTGAAEDPLVSSAAELLPPLPAGADAESVLKPEAAAGITLVDFTVNFGW